jgi:hypothetical protein
MPPVKPNVPLGLTLNDASEPIASVRMLGLRFLPENTIHARYVVEAAGPISGLSVSTTTTGSTARAGAAVATNVPNAHARAISSRAFMLPP